MIAKWNEAARAIRRDTYALYLACRDPRVPWYAKALAGMVLAYALSPIDLIPDFIPVVGYLDDLILIPVGLALVRKMIPASVFAEYRATAEAHLEARAPESRLGLVIVLAIWVVLAAFIGYVIVY